MFISILDLFKIGIGPSSSHTLGPMVAAKQFIQLVREYYSIHSFSEKIYLRCTLKGSLAFTGKGHSTDRAVALGLHGYAAENLVDKNVLSIMEKIWASDKLNLSADLSLKFSANKNIIFDKSAPLIEHPNGMIFELVDEKNNVLLAETYFSIGGGFINTLAEINQLTVPLKMQPSTPCSFPFDSAASMLQMASETQQSIAQMKKSNELEFLIEAQLTQGVSAIWQSMKYCIEKGLAAEGVLPGGLNLPRRAKALHQQMSEDPKASNINDWLCAYAMAVNEENAAGNMVVTAPTNGAAGVIPAVLYYYLKHEHDAKKDINDIIQNYLLTASAIGGLVKHRSSISGAEVGCQGEVGTASAMAAAGLCEIRGGTPSQVEHAAEIALEHHLGMTCDPVNGLVQVPCIERNGFGAIKAYTAASLALRGDGVHFMPLDNCIEAMKQTGLEMSHKFKETSLGGLALTITEC